MLPTNENQPQEHAQQATQNHTRLEEASHFINEYLTCTFSGQLLTEEQKQKLKDIFHLPDLSESLYEQIEKIVAAQGRITAMNAASATQERKSFQMCRQHHTDWMEHLLLIIMRNFCNPVLKNQNLPDGVHKSMFQTHSNTQN
ncbi:hypothetical protein B9Z55_024142 [Caenorhabditis nigoni]|uniref:Uncharacterized protein n=1 Tax=Caenorhabditis nigoni TaxID=1611254 RepID=A0A2G5STE4_9PELO|nr:hypothetical protein B9Z55_024142 [Caenorhabditis nigoni]